MWKVPKRFHQTILESKVYMKYFAKHNPGERIVPNKTKDSELRYDAGEETPAGDKNVYLQVNSEPKNTALKKYVSKHGTHSNVATSKIKADTPEHEQEDEIAKAFEKQPPSSRRKLAD